MAFLQSNVLLWVGKLWAYCRRDPQLVISGQCSWGFSFSHATVRKSRFYWFQARTTDENNSGFIANEIQINPFTPHLLHARLRSSCTLLKAYFSAFLTSNGEPTSKSTERIACSSKKKGSSACDNTKHERTFLQLDISGSAQHTKHMPSLSRVHVFAHFSLGHIKAISWKYSATVRDTRSRSTVGKHNSTFLFRD